MTKIALWIHISADDWAAESAIKASNGEFWIDDVMGSAKVPREVGKY